MPLCVKLLCVKLLPLEEDEAVLFADHFQVRVMHIGFAISDAANEVCRFIYLAI